MSQNNNNNTVDIVQSFLNQENKEFQISIFLQTLPYLEKYQDKHGEVTFYDVYEALEILSPDLPPDDRKVYATLIYEAALLPKMIGERPGMKLNRKYVRGNTKGYVNFLEEVMKEHAESMPNSSGKGKIDKFVVIASLLFPGDPAEKSITAVKPASLPQAQPQPQPQALSPVQSQPVVAQPPPQVTSQPLPIPETAFRPQTALPPPVYEPSEDYERFEESSIPETNPTNEHVVRFLAHIRKSYMDMIFPQSLYDQLLLVIYVATKCGAPLAHRELMDMVLSAKERRVMPGVETISKTKVRGVFSLLKNAQALETSDGVGEGVRLFMGRGISSFRDFREKHDAFIQKCLIQQHFFIPINSRRELVWPTEREELAPKLLELTKFEKMLDDYFMNGGAMFTNSSQQQQPMPPPKQQQTQRPAYYQPSAPVQQAPRHQKQLQRGNFPNMNNQGRYQQHQQQQQQQQGYYGRTQNQNRQYYPTDPNAGYDWDNESSDISYQQYGRTNNNANNQQFYQKNDAQYSNYGLSNTYEGGAGAGNEFTDYENSSFSGSSLYSRAPSSFLHPNQGASASSVPITSSSLLNDHENNQHLYSSWNVDLPTSQSQSKLSDSQLHGNTTTNSFGLDFASLGGSVSNNEDKALAETSSVPPGLGNVSDFPTFTPSETTLANLNATLDYPSTGDRFSF